MADTIESLVERWNGRAALVARDPGSGSWIFLALHDNTLGNAAGGTRLKSYDSPADGLRDAMRLAEGNVSRAAQSRGAVVQSKAYGVEDRALARTGWAGDSEQSGLRQHSLVEIDLEVGKARQVLAADCQDSHGRSILPTSSTSS